MTVEPEIHEDDLDNKDGEAHDSCSKFQIYHSLTQTIFEIDPI